MTPRSAYERPREKPLSLKGRRIILVLGAAAAISALAQLMLGASLAVVVFALLAVISGLFGLVALGANNLGAWVAMFYALGNVLVALYAKTLLGQTLDSYLYAPVDSFLALALTSGALLIALLLVRQVSVGRTLFEARSDPQFLVFLSWACFALGVFFWLLNRWFQDPGGSGFGGITLFRDLLYMAVIARTAMLLESSGNRCAFDSRLGCIMAVGAFLGLIDNSKTIAALPIVSHFVTVLFFRQRLSMRMIVAMLLGGVIFASVVAPMIHAMRWMGQQELSVIQRTELVASSVSSILKDPDRLDSFVRSAVPADWFGHYNYFGRNGTGQMLLGRYASVQQIDPVIAEVNRQGPRGGSAVWPALARLVPSFIYPEKPQYTEAYKTLVYYGLVDPEGGKYPTLPLAGQAYAGYGLFGLLTIPFVTFLAFLLVVKKLGWRLYRNVYAIFFFCSFVIVYASQGDFGQYAAATVRSFPLFAFVFWLIGSVYRIRLRRHHNRYRRLIDAVPVAR